MAPLCGVFVLLPFHKDKHLVLAWIIFLYLQPACKNCKTPVPWMPDKAAYFNSKGVSTFCQMA